MSEATLDCTACGTANRSQAAFCFHCGNALDRGTGALPPIVPPPVPHRFLTGTLLQTYQGHRRLVQSVALSPDGAQALSGSGTLLLWLDSLQLFHPPSTEISIDSSYEI